MFNKFLNIFKEQGKDWSLKDPSKKGGSYSIYYKDKHITSVRGKNKANVLINAIKGVDMSHKLDMKSSNK